jgi:tetratricopeptide (TPR) repeat protein
VSLLDDPGDLAEVPLAAVLIEVLNGRATGALTVEHGGGASRVYLRDGIPVGAQSFTGFRPLGQALLAAGLIDVAALGASLAEIARSGRPQGEVLVEMGAVRREDVDRALSEQQAGYLTHIAGLASGRFSFDAAAPVPAWTADIRISPLQAIVEALERPQASPLVVAALQPVAEGPIALAPGYRKLAGAFGWTEAEAALVDRLQTLTTLDAFFAETTVSPERARAILAALLLLDLAAVRSAPVRDPLDTVPGVVFDLADLAGVPIEAEPGLAPEVEALDPEAPWAPDDHSLASAAREIPQPMPAVAPPAPAPDPGAPPQPAAPLRRSDPVEARRRRQRLLQRAMQNMGVGPLSGQPPPAGARRPGAHAEAPPGRHLPLTPAEEELKRALDAAAPRATALDLFDRLGLPTGATREQVKAAYFHLAKTLHPDRFAAPALAHLAPRVKDLFASINEAYDVLSDERKRAAYLSRAGPGGPGVWGGDRGSAAVDFQKAEACARTRDWARARGFYEAALRADPRPEWQAAYAAMLLAEPGGDRARARALAEAALRDPACDRAAVVRAVLAREEGDLEAADRLLRRALAANPRNPDAERELRLVEARAQKPSGLSGLFRKR